MDPVDLGRVDEAMPTEQDARVDDEAVEDVLLRLRQDVLDPAQVLAVARVDGSPLGEREV